MLGILSIALEKYMDNFSGPETVFQISKHALTK